MTEIVPGLKTYLIACILLVAVIGCATPALGQSGCGGTYYGRSCVNPYYAARQYVPQTCNPIARPATQLVPVQPAPPETSGQCAAANCQAQFSTLNSQLSTLNSRLSTLKTELRTELSSEMQTLNVEDLRKGLRDELLAELKLAMIHEVERQVQAAVDALPQPQAPEGIKIDELTAAVLERMRSAESSASYATLVVDPRGDYWGWMQDEVRDAQTRYSLKVAFAPPEHTLGVLPALVFYHDGTPVAWFRGVSDVRSVLSGLRAGKLPFT